MPRKAFITHVATGKLSDGDEADEVTVAASEPRCLALRRTRPNLALNVAAY